MKLKTVTQTISVNADKALYSPPMNLDDSLTVFLAHCVKKKLKNTTIALYEKEIRWFLNLLASNGCSGTKEFDTNAVISACLQMSRASYWTTIKTFMKFLYEMKYTDRDYSYVIPHYRRPKVIPSVYSEVEIRNIEKAISKPSTHNKRDLAALMLATRLGMRAGDIITLTFDSLDFSANMIEFKQDKTGMPLKLPMLSELKSALLDYIQTQRPSSDSPYVFLNSVEPYDHMTYQGFHKYISAAIKRAGIVSGARCRGARAFRSSLASSMVNDNIPYEAVRRTLGHRDFNVIRHYAELDIEQLRLYALKPPKETGIFEKFLRGGRI